MDRFWIMAKTFPVSLNLSDQVSGLVIGIPVKPVKKHITIDQTGGKFCPELRGSGSLTPNNGFRWSMRSIVTRLFRHTLFGQS